MPHVIDRANGSERRFRGLILDFAGVLTTDVLPVHRAWCESEGLAPETWRYTLNDHPEGRRLYADLEIGAISQEEWNRSTAQLLGVEHDENLMGRAWAKVEPAVDMIALARAAREAGYAVAMLSNSFGLAPYDPYAAIGVWDLFDVTVVSERERVAKPDPAIYRTVLERMALPGEQCVFVDDHERNLPPAREAGMTTVLAKPGNGAVARLEMLLGIEAACTA
ncbi:HAD family phosphatase [Streptomyces blastmyceticus]|uniref:HAD-IA family hydrolase n=1 Tax=Streptomyces blastmyceticus TaxID=68180 RepID=A0ABN0Y1T1_9ACTN